MNKWYRSAPCKGILVVLAYLCVIVLAICGVAAITSPGLSYFRTVSEKRELKYEESAAFGGDVTSDAHDVLAYLIQKNNFETEGNYNPDKIVDIKDYLENGRVSGTDISGISFTINELIKVGEQLDESNGDGPHVIVCQKEDGTYDYYMAEAFEAMVKAGKLYITTNDYYMTASELYSDLKRGNISRALGEDIPLEDESGTMVYKGCWNLWGNDGYSAAQGIITTAPAQKILETAGSDPAWNGKLDEALERLYRAAASIMQDIEHYKQGNEKWSEGNTNLTYLFGDLKQQKVYTNRAAYVSFETLMENVETITAQGKYIVAAPKLANFHTNMDTEAGDWKETLTGYADQLGADDYIFAVSVDTTYNIQDDYYSRNKAYDAYEPWFEVVWISACTAMLALLIILIWLTIVAGRTPNGQDVSLNFFDRIKTEIAVAMVGLSCSFLLLAGTSWGGFTMSFRDFWWESYIVQTVSLTLWVIGLFTAVLTGYLSLVRRLKAHTLWSNSCIRWLFHLIRELVRHRKSTTKTILMFAGLSFLQILLIASRADGFYVLLMCVVGFLFFLYAMRGAIAKQRIKGGIERITNGEVDYQIPLEGLSGENLDMATRINNIGEGLNKAMEENLKSERLKTDLITNVSHDIKTPLTSIINYVDILKRENFEDAKIRGYLDILEAKSQRLKHLTEDVVEASKISSGNISLEFVNLNLVEMINQTNGEFAEKFAAKNLEVIQKLPDVPAVIHADGRRMWRVLENVYNNAAKYAMEGTRIYGDLVVKARTVEFSLKNISQYPLNISADELTERFIRGDVSRSTEGSGLGLSIAKNLTTIQGGTFELYLDGDLFKVTIIFPKVFQKVEKERPIEREMEETETKA